VATPLEVAAVGAETDPVPAVTEKLMVLPSATIWPCKSVATACTVLVLDPSAVRVLGVAVTDIVFTRPGIKLTDVFPDTPPAMAVTVAEPRLVELVRVAVAFPLAVMELKVIWVPAVTLSISPSVVEKSTVVPSGMLLPLVSLTAAVIRVVEVPLATISELIEVTVTEPTMGATRVILTVEETLPDWAITVSMPAVVEAV